MKKIDDPLQNDFGTLSQKTGLNCLKMFTRVVSRLRINSLNNICGQYMSRNRQPEKGCFFHSDRAKANGGISPLSK